MIIVHIYPIHFWVVMQKKIFYLVLFNDSMPLLPAIFIISLHCIVKPWNTGGIEFCDKFAI